ncbi:MAG: YetF domain-containing protein [Paenisporosarcina sp.]
MDFFHSQESLTSLQWILRAFIAFFFLIIVAKLMGHRSISQLGLLDFIMAISIGNIIAHPLSDETLGLRGSLITMSSLVILYLMGIFLTLKSVKLRNLLDPKPIPLIKNGQIIFKSLSKARISIDVLLSEMRKAQIEEVQKVALALWETNGTISFFLDPQYQPLTPSDMNLVSSPFDLPKTIIKEGKIDVNELSTLGKDKKWVIGKMKSTFQLDVNEILLATIDKNELIKIILYK